MTSHIEFNPRVIEERMNAIRAELLTDSVCPYETLGSPKIEVNRDYIVRREAMKRAATRKLISNTIDVVICGAIALIMLAVIYLIAVATLPMVGGIACLIALSACIYCVCNSFSKS